MPSPPKPKPSAPERVWVLVSGTGTATLLAQTLSAAVRNRWGTEFVQEYRLVKPARRRKAGR